MPHLTELRCRACSVFGGCEIQTPAEAAELEAIPRVRLGASRIRNGEQTMEGDFIPTVGAHASLPPCVSAAELDEINKATGRPCPLVPLRLENGLAARLTFLSMGEDPLTPLFFDTVMAEEPITERRRLLERVMDAKGARDVSEARKEVAKAAQAEAKQNARRRR